MDVTLSGLLNLVLWVAIVGGVCWLLWWLVSYIGLPAPFDKVLRAIIAVVAVVFLINLLIGLGGGTPFIRLK